MRAEVVFDAPTMMVNVYVIQDGLGSVARVWTPTGAGYDWTEVPVGGEMPVSLAFPRDIWEALNAAAADVPMPGRALADHLADTIAVRDRLLAMAERSALRPLPSDA
jgi:hypothetical protein